MLYSILNDENNYYINIHAECALHTYVNNFMEEDEENIKNISRQQQGMYCKKANADIFTHIYEYAYEDKNLCIDFNIIEDVFENNLILLVSFIKRQFCAKNRNVYLLNLNKNIYGKMNLGDTCQIIQETDNILSVKLGTARDVMTYSEILNKPRQLFEDKLEKIINECTVELLQEDEVHTSVPVYLSKYINIKKMAESNSRFFRLGIYYLALKLLNQGVLKQDYIYNRDMSLFFHTINGGFIATQLAQLFNIDMVYLDHLGPLENVHRKHFEKSILDSKNYIIVSDVICLGGEVGRAKTIIEYCGGSVSGEVCIVDIKTIENKSMDNRTSLYTVSKEQNSIGYLIRTDLCYECKKEDACDK